MKKGSVYLKRLYGICKNILHPAKRYLKQGYRGGLLTLYCKHFVVRHLQEFSAAVKRETEEMEFVDGIRIQKLRTLTGGLHTLYPYDRDYFYSILIAIDSKDQTPLSCLERCFRSALQQTAPRFEVLVGYSDSSLPEEILQIQAFCRKHSDRFRIFAYSDSPTEHLILNRLANESKGNYLLPLRKGDWIRPDYLYRCEQFLRIKKVDSPVGLYTDQFLVNDRGYPLPGKFWKKPASLCFPYHFKDDVGHSLLVDRESWMKSGGLRRDLSSQGLWELAMRADAIGCRFYSIPFGLYAHRRSVPDSIADCERLFSSLRQCSQNKGLDWDWAEGMLPHTVRAIPRIEKKPSIQVIVPYKNQRELTLKAVKSALSQQGVSVFVTAVDNRSDDREIADEIEGLGGEAIRVDEPFNYSRLNNLAVERTKIAGECDLVLFLNNDVELEAGALLEMARWIRQPGIGIVGCCLRYPNGLLQHGGVDIIRHGPGHQVTWSHSEKMREPSKMSETRTLRLTDAATAACAMMNRRQFIALGGFDEMWYPVSYSDTNLAVKVHLSGLKSFYTPYAEGVHFESLSRDVENIEDVETSRWLHELFIEKWSEEQKTRRNPGEKQAACEVRR